MEEHIFDAATSALKASIAAVEGNPHLASKAHAKLRELHTASCKLAQLLDDPVSAEELRRIRSAVKAEPTPHDDDTSDDEDIVVEEIHVSDDDLKHLHVDDDIDVEERLRARRSTQGTEEAKRPADDDAIPVPRLPTTVSASTTTVSASTTTDDSPTPVTPEEKEEDIVDDDDDDDDIIVEEVELTPEELASFTTTTTVESK